MSVWSELDALVAKHKQQAQQLRSLASEGGVFRKPRFRPPCVWVLIFGAKSPRRGERVVHTTFEAARAELEPHAQRKRGLLAEKAKAKAEARKARAKR